MTEILGAVNVRTNADLIAYVAPLYLEGDKFICDVTWGKGNWWKKWQPEPFHFTRHDKYTLDGVDFTAQPEPDNTFDVVCFDPPYVSKGGRKTSGIVKFDDAYGLRDAPKTPQLMFEWHCLGLAECVRVTKPGGLIFLKSMNYVSSGKIQWATRWLVDHAESKLDLTIEDEFIHVGHIRPQPKGRRQVHARRNYSYLHVFRKAR